MGILADAMVAGESSEKDIYSNRETDEIVMLKRLSLLVFICGIAWGLSPQAKAASVITFYKKQGENNVDCRITMGNGTVNFRQSSNSCSNDDDYYFSVSGAQDGVEFGIYNNPDCRTNERYATYKMGNGDGNRDIRLTAVDASRNLSENTLIHDTLRAGSGSSGGQLHGKVSCLRVWGVKTDDALRVLPPQ